MSDLSIKEIFEMSGATSTIGRSIITKALVRSLNFFRYDIKYKNDLIRAINTVDYTGKLVKQGNEYYRVFSDTDMTVQKLRPAFSKFQDDLSYNPVTLTGDYNYLERPYTDFSEGLKLIERSYASIGRRFDLDGSMKFLATTNIDLNLDTTNKWLKKRNTDINSSVENKDLVIWFKNTEEVKALQPDYSGTNVEAPLSLLKTVLGQSGIPYAFVLGDTGDTSVLSFINQLTRSYFEFMGIDYEIDYGTLVAFTTTAGYKYEESFVEVDKERERFSKELDLLVKEKEAMLNAKYQAQQQAQQEAKQVKEVNEVKETEEANSE